MTEKNLLRFFGLGFGQLNFNGSPSSPECFEHGDLIERDTGKMFFVVSRQVSPAWLLPDLFDPSKKRAREPSPLRQMQPHRGGRGLGPRRPSARTTRVCDYV